MCYTVFIFQNNFLWLIYSLLIVYILMQIMAGMDVDTYEGYPIREQLNITGFPTLIYFE